MSKRNKIFRDAPAGLLMTISLALSLFVLLNVTELMDKIITESKSQQKYNYSYEFTVCFQEAEEKSLEDVQIEKLQDILMNVRVGNLSFINAYIGVDESMCRFPAEILFTANENLKYQFKHKDAEDAQWEIAISSELGNYMKKENDGYKIRILGEWCKVYDNFEIGKIAVLAFVFAVLMQFIYTLITGNIGEFFKISLIKVSIMAIGMLVIVLVVALFPMKRINKISLAEAFTE